MFAFLTSRRNARFAAEAAAHRHEYELVASDPRAWDDEDLALYTRDEINVLIAANDTARRASCHCADALSLRPEYVCPAGHTY